MKGSDLTADLDALAAFKDQLHGLVQYLDQVYRPTILRLTARNLPSTDGLCDRVQEFATAADELGKILGGVTYAGGDEGAYLYWEFELSEDRTEEQAIAAVAKRSAAWS